VDGKVPPEDLTSIPTFQADHVIAMNRPPYRDRGRPLDRRFRWLAQAPERLMHGRDQGSDLIGAERIMPKVGSDNFSREFSIGRCGPLFVGHRTVSRFLCPSTSMRLFWDDHVGALSRYRRSVHYFVGFSIKFRGFLLT
jgi:hypothetical protein